MGFHLFIYFIFITQNKIGNITSNAITFANSINSLALDTTNRILYASSSKVIEKVSVYPINSAQAIAVSSNLPISGNQFSIYGGGICSNPSCILIDIYQFDQQIIGSTTLDFNSPTLIQFNFSSISSIQFGDLNAKLSIISGCGCVAQNLTVKIGFYVPSKYYLF